MTRKTTTLTISEDTLATILDTLNEAWEEAAEMPDIANRIEAAVAEINDQIAEQEEDDLDAALGQLQRAIKGVWSAGAVPMVQPGEGYPLYIETGLPQRLEGATHGGMPVVTLDGWDTADLVYEEDDEGA